MIAFFIYCCLRGRQRRWVSGSALILVRSSHAARISYPIKSFPLLVKKSDQSKLIDLSKVEKCYCKKGCKDRFALLKGSGNVKMSVNDVGLLMLQQLLMI